MNRKLNAVALSNKALTEENKRLWAENDMVRRGMEEKERMNSAMLTQLILKYGVNMGDGATVVLPKTNVTEIMAKYHVEGMREEDGALTLRVVMNNNENGEDGNEVDQDNAEGNTAESERVSGQGDAGEVPAGETDLDGRGDVDHQVAGDQTAGAV